MRLTQFSDYSLRTLLYLGVHRERLVPVVEISRAYRISYNHLVKVVRELGSLGVVEATRGRGGGLKLVADPASLRLGWLVRHTEPDMDLVECFNSHTDQCPITPVCQLRTLLLEARTAFFASLDRHTLADLLSSPEQTRQLVQLWGVPSRWGIPLAG